MGTTLTGTTPQDTYDSLIKVTDNGPISATAKFLSDGLGNDSVLALSTSKVGVGTTTPQGKLSVSSGAAGGGYNSDYDELVLTNAGRVGINILSSAVEYSAIIMGGAADNTTGGIYHKADTKMLSFATNDTFRMNIDSSGNVGIGTSAPADKLTVKGVVKLLNNEVAAGYSTLDLVPATAIGASANRIAALNTTDIAFETGAAERFRITNNGVTFNGDTAAANALDDYEEGTWTMGVSFGGASVGVTTSANLGTYTKIGRQVTVNGLLTLSSKGSSSGSVRITGLPFTVPNFNQNYSAASLWMVRVSFANQFIGYGLTNTTSIPIEEVTEAGTVSAITDADFANNSEIMVSLTYFV